MSPLFRPVIFIIPFILLALAAIAPYMSALAATTTATSSATSTSDVEVATSTVVTPPVDTTKVVLSTVAQTRITNLAANVSNRLDATLRRLTNVHGRIATRIEKLSQTGMDTQAASTELRLVESHLATAKTSLTTIDRNVIAFIGSSNPRAGFARLKTTYTSIYTELVSAHRSLRLTLNLLSDTIPVSVAPTATTTTAE